MFDTLADALRLAQTLRVDARAYLSMMAARMPVGETRATAEEVARLADTAPLSILADALDVTAMALPVDLRNRDRFVRRSIEIGRLCRATEAVAAGNA